MENTTNLNKKRPLFERLARLFFIVYMVTLYVFVDKVETVGISRIIFLVYAGFAGLTLLNRKRIHLGENVMTSYLAITWMYATTFWAYNSYWASYKMNTVWQVFLLFFLTYNLFVEEEEEAHEYLMKCLYISGISLLAYSIYTYGFSQVIEMMTSAGGVRLGREISHENTFGMYNATTVIVAFYYLIHKNRYKLFNVAVVVVSFLFAMSSGSRKALLMICAGVLVIVYRKYGIKKFYKVIAITLVLVLLLMMVMKLPMFDFIRNRLEMGVETVDGSGNGDKSANARYDMIVDGWKIFKERLLIGYGADNYAVVTGYRTYSHNNFIEILVDFGLIGFILYYLSYIFAFKNLLKAKNDAGKALTAIFLVRLFMEVAVVTYYSKMNWILLAFFLVGKRKKKDKNAELAIETPKEWYGESARKIVNEEKEGSYECEYDNEETEEGSSQSETFAAGDSGEGELCPTLCGQGVSEIEILGDNGQKAQS